MSAFSLYVCSNVPFTARATVFALSWLVYFTRPVSRLIHVSESPFRRPSLMDIGSLYFLSFSCIHPFVAVKGAAVNMDPCPNPIFIWLGFVVLFIWVLIYSSGFGVYPRASCIWGKPSSAELHHRCLVLSFGHAPTNGLAILALVFLLAVVRLLQVGPVLSGWCLQEHPVPYTHSPARGLAQEGNTPTKGWC